MHAAIQSIPAIRAGLATKTLEVKVSGPGEDFPILTGTAKRTFSDKRVAALIMETDHEIHEKGLKATLIPLRN